ncbi:unnamed protein product, partial [Prorocentrum cordatum]
DAFAAWAGSGAEGAASPAEVAVLEVADSEPEGAAAGEAPADGGLLFDEGAPEGEAEPSVPAAGQRAERLRALLAGGACERLGLGYEDLLAELAAAAHQAGPVASACPASAAPPPRPAPPAAFAPRASRRRDAAGAAADAGQAGAARAALPLVAVTGGCAGPRDGAPAGPPSEASIDDEWADGARPAQPVERDAMAVGVLKPELAPPADVSSALVPAAAAVAAAAAAAAAPTPAVAGKCAAVVAELLAILSNPSVDAVIFGALGWDEKRLPVLLDTLKRSRHGGMAPTVARPAPFCALRALRAGSSQDADFYKDVSNWNTALRVAGELRSTSIELAA